MEYGSRVLFAIALVLLAALLLGPTFGARPSDAERERQCHDAIQRMNDPTCEEFRDVH